MNLFRSYCILKSLYRRIDHRSVATVTSGRWREGSLPNYSLQTRFLDFMEKLEDSNTSEDDESRTKKLIVPQKVKSAIKIQKNLHPVYNGKTKDAEYKSIVRSIEKHAMPVENAHSANHVQLIDQKCCRILGHASHSQIFNLFRLLTKAFPNELTSMEFYKLGLQALRTLLPPGKLDNHEILQLLFFQSWNQKGSTRNVKFILTYMPPLGELSLIERTIVAQSTYQCAISLKEDDIRVLQNTIESNAASLINDNPILATLCKPISLAGPTNDCHLVELSKAIMEYPNLIHIVNAVHLLNLYGKTGVQRPDVIQKLFHHSMVGVAKNRKFDRAFRLKDVERALWAASMLDYKFTDFNINELSWFLERKHEDLKKEPVHLVHIILALWILNWKETTLLKKCFADKLFQPIYDDSVMWKRKARLQLLITCAEIEAPEIEIPEEFSEPYNVKVKVAVSVRKLHGFMERSKESLNIEEVKIEAPIHGLNIAGVSFKHKKSIYHIDVLDEAFCFKGTTVTRGYMSLKLRLIPKIGLCSIVMTPAEANDTKWVSKRIKKCIRKSLT